MLCLVHGIGTPHHVGMAHPVTTYDLAPGQSVSLWLRRGTTLQLLDGSMQVQPPAIWLAGSVLQRNETWNPGHGEHVLDAGTWHCQARTHCVLLVQPPWLVRLLVSLWRYLRASGR